MCSAEQNDKNSTLIKQEMLALQSMLNSLDYKRKVSDNVLSFVVNLLSPLIPTPNTQMRMCTFLNFHLRRTDEFHRS